MLKHNRSVNDYMKVERIFKTKNNNVHVDLIPEVMKMQWRRMRVCLCIIKDLLDETVSIISFY